MPKQQIKTRLTKLEDISGPQDIEVILLKPGEVPARPAVGEQTIWVRPGGGVTLTYSNYFVEVQREQRDAVDEN